MNVLDLFSGIGGFSLGLERAGMKTVAFCEVDKACRQVLRKHWPHVPIFEDVKTLSAKDIDGTVDIIVGGFPCQDISVAGKGAGLAGARSGLWWEFHRLIKEIKPSWVIAENVSALRSRGLDEVLRSLAEIGYDAEWHCIPASAIGAPHQRDRIWIVAYPRHGSRGDFGVAQEGHHSQSQRPADSDTVGGSGKQPTAMADSGSLGSLSQSKRDDRSLAEASCGEEKAGHQSSVRSSPCSSTMADAESQRIQGLRAGGQQEPRPYVRPELLVRCRERCSETDWKVEPNVGRVADGVSGRVDRLKQLGNAVVPQIPELIGRAIMEAAV